MSAFRLSLCAVLLAGAALAQAPKETGSVEGKVTFNGKPVTEGKLEFHPDKGKHVTADLQKDGTYTAKAVPVGKLTVVVKVKGLPAKYESRKTSPLVAEVKKGKQTLDFDLK